MQLPLTGIHSLPSDVLNIIYDYLPKETRAFTMSKVSHAWRLTALTKYQEQAKTLLLNKITESQIDISLLYQTRSQTLYLDLLRLRPIDPPRSPSR